MLLTAAKVVLRLSVVRVILLLMLLPAAATRMLLKFVLLCVLVSARLLRSLVLDGPVLVVSLICSARRRSSAPATLISLFVVRLRLIVILILIVLPVEILSLALAPAKAWLHIVVTATSHLSRGSLMIISLTLHLGRGVCVVVIQSVVRFNDVVPIALAFIILSSFTFLSLASSSLAESATARTCHLRRSSTSGKVVRTISDFHTNFTIFSLSSMRFCSFVRFHLPVVKSLEQIVKSLLDCILKLVRPLLAALVRVRPPRMLRPFRSPRVFRKL